MNNVIISILVNLGNKFSIICTLEVSNHCFVKRGKTFFKKVNEEKKTFPCSNKVDKIFFVNELV